MLNVADLCGQVDLDQRSLSTQSPSLVVYQRLESPASGMKAVKELRRVGGQQESKDFLENHMKAWSSTHWLLQRCMMRRLVPAKSLPVC